MRGFVDGASSADGPTFAGLTDAGAGHEATVSGRMSADPLVRVAMWRIDASGARVRRAGLREAWLAAGRVRSWSGCATGSCGISRAGRHATAAALRDGLDAELLLVVWAVPV